MLPLLRASPVGIVPADDLGTGYNSPDRSYSPGRGTMRSSIAVSWSDYPHAKEQQAAVDLRLPTLSRPTSRQQNMHFSPSTIGSQRSREPMNSSTTSSMLGESSSDQQIDREVRRTTQQYQPTGDPLKIMRLAKVGAMPTNANPKLTRLAAMMDQFKLNEYVRLDAPLPSASRPVSRQSNSAISSAAGSMAAYPRSGGASLSSPEDQSLTSHRTFSPANTSPNSSVLEQIRNTPTISGGSPSKPLPPISRDTTPPPAAQRRDESPAPPTFHHPDYQHSPTQLLQQLTKEEDYWRGYTELEEAQRRYYMWTFLRRGEMPLASKTFQVGLSPSVSHEAVAADISRLRIEAAASPRPSSAATTSLVHRMRLPQRPSSGAITSSASKVVPPIVTLNSASSSPRQPQQAPTGVSLTTRVILPVPLQPKEPAVHPLLAVQISSMRSPQTTSGLLASTDPHRLNSPLRLDGMISPTSTSSVSPRGAVARDLARKFTDALDDLEEDELYERNATESKEEHSWSKIILVPWLIKVTPLQEASCRRDLSKIQQDVFFHLVTSMSRYLYLMERFYVEARSAKLTLFDQGLASWQRRVHQRLDIENEEVQQRGDLLQEEAHVTRFLMRRWHQHVQVMLLRTKAYTNAMATFAAISHLAATEDHERHVMELDTETSLLDVRRLQSLEEVILESHRDTYDAMRVWFAESCGAVRRQTRLLQEIHASMGSLEDAEQLRRETLTRVGVEELVSRHLLEGSVRGCLNAVSLATTHHMAKLNIALEDESRHTQMFVEHHQQILHPEKNTRRTIGQQEEHLWDQCLRLDDITRWRDSQVNFFYRQAVMDLNASTNLFEALVNVMKEEYDAREKVLDLEDEAYEDDFIICHQRMRRLDTVRSFIIASPGDERRSRLSVEAEYREGLYELMELNDECEQMSKTAEGLCQTKWMIFRAEEQIVEMHVHIIFPETHARARMEEDGSTDYALLCSTNLSQMQMWEASVQEVYENSHHAIEDVYSQAALSVQSSSELTFTEERRRIEAEYAEAHEWVQWSGRVRLMKLAALETIQRKHLIVLEEECMTPAMAAHKHVQRLDALCTSLMPFREVRFHDVELETMFDVAASHVVASHHSLLATLDSNRSALPFAREEASVLLHRVKEHEWQYAATCGVPRAIALENIHSSEALSWQAMQHVATTLYEMTSTFDASRTAQEDLFGEYTASLRRLMMPTMERMHRQRVTMGEKSQWKWLQKMHDALRTTHTNAILAILDEHHAAVVSFNELSFAAHAAVLKNVEEQLIAQEERQREVMEKREDDHRDVTRSAQRSLRWNVVTLQQHHAAVAASLESERGNASNRHQFGDDEGSERELVEAKEKKVRLELISIFNDLTRQHFSNERSHKVAHEELFDQCSSSLLQFLKSLHQDHPADLADKAPYMLTNDGTCTMLDFSSFHRNGNRCSDDTIDTIASLMRHTKHVEHIIIRNNVMSEFGGRLTKRGIITLTTLFHQLTRVDLRNCKIGDEEAKILFRAVENHPDPVLEVLALDDNLITSDGCRQLLNTLRAPNSPLVDVTVTGNEGIPKGMMSVVAFYCQLNRQTPALKTHVLRIEENDPAITFWSGRTLRLTDEHAKLVCVALFQNTHITHVDLEDQPELTDASCNSIASMLRGNASIARIDMSGTSITDVGLQQLEHVLKQQPYRQPLMFKDLFGAPAAQLLRRRSSRFLTRSLSSADSPGGLRRGSVRDTDSQSPQRLQSVTSGTIEDNGALTSFTLSIHRTRISDKKYLACVLSMNELERAMIEMDEDDAYEVTMMCFFHMRDLVEDQLYALQEFADVYDAAEALQHKYFTERVFFPLETRQRQSIRDAEDVAHNVVCSYVANVVEAQRVFDAAVVDLTTFHQRQVQLAIAALRMREWEPNHQQRIALEEIWVPEHKERKGVEEEHIILTHNTVERYHKYVLGSWKFFEKCLAAKQQAFDKHSRDAKSLARKQSVFSLSALARQNDSDVSEANFVPMELDPKQHQALAHLGNQPWELQGKGLAIAQNDPAVTTLDISFAGVANKEEPPCSQDTIAVLFTLAKHNTVLQEVNIAGNPGAITARCAPLLAKLAVRLKVLNIADCNVSETDVLPHLLGALTQPNVHLETLILDGNTITAQGATQICRALRGNVSVSQVSLVRTPQPIPKVSQDFIQFYTDVNKLPKAYRTLIRRMESNDATCTEADFTNHSALTGALRPHHNDISSAAGCDSDDDAVAAYGGQDGERDIALDDAAIKLVCIALSRNMVLERLLLAGNQVSDRGIKFLSHIMQSSPSLRFVDLSQNKFTDVGANLLIKAAEKNNRLQDIRVSTNDGSVGVHSRRMLLAQLQKNKS